MKSSNGENYARGGVWGVCASVCLLCGGGGGGGAEGGASEGVGYRVCMGVRMFTKFSL